MPAKNPSPNSLYDKEYYSTLSTRAGTLKKAEEVIRLVELKEGMSILDIGTGRGELAIECAKRGCEVKAIDFSSQAIELAEEDLRNYPQEIQNRITFQEMDAKKITYPKDSFDLVFLLDLIEHVTSKDLGIIFEEIKRVIKPEGKLILHTSPNRLLIGPAFFLAGIFFKGKEWPSRKYDINEQSYFSLRRNLLALQRKFNISMTKKKSFFYRQIAKKEDIGPRVKILVRIVDGLLDNRLVFFLINHSFFKIFLASDLWTVVDFGKKR